MSAIFEIQNSPLQHKLFFIPSTAYSKTSLFLELPPLRWQSPLGYNGMLYVYRLHKLPNPPPSNTIFSNVTLASVLRVNRVEASDRGKQAMVIRPVDITLKEIFRLFRSPDDENVAASARPKRRGRPVRRLFQTSRTTSVDCPFSLLSSRFGEYSTPGYMLPFTAVLSSLVLQD